MRILFQNQQNNYPTGFAEEKIKACLEKAYALSEPGQSEAYIAQVSVFFVTAQEMQDINKDERGVDQLTDVLSFPLLEMEDGRFLEALTEADLHPDFSDEDEAEDERDEEEQAEAAESIEAAGEDTSAGASEEDENEPLFLEDDACMILELGDIVICPERAGEQAEAYGHSLLREYCFLALHGFLHLIGYDHERGEEAEKEMFGLQERVLEEVGISRDPEAYPPEEDEKEAGKNYFTHDLDGEPLPENFRSGFAAILGRPNAGKSTLLNRLSGDELAIVSHKAQTTRHNIRTVLDDGSSQIIFVDTPGIHRSHNKLDRYMTDSAWFALQDADLGLLLVDPAKAYITEVEKVCCQKADELGIPLILVLTKIDAQAKEALLPVIARYSEFYNFAEIIPISAEKNENIDLLLSKIKEYLPRGPRYYSPDAYTDQTERALAAEYIREQLLHYTHQEVPHKAAVYIDEFKEIENEEGERVLARIMASIIVDKPSHKGIVIGKKGQSLKRIGQSARIKLEELLGCKVYLDIHVKVREGWQSNDAMLKTLGYVKGKSGQSAEDIL